MDLSSLLGLLSLLGRCHPAPLVNQLAHLALLVRWGQSIQLALLALLGRSVRLLSSLRQWGLWGRLAQLGR